MADERAVEILRKVDEMYRSCALELHEKQIGQTQLVLIERVRFKLISFKFKSIKCSIDILEWFIAEQQTI